MQLLLDAMTKKDSHQARFCAVYWANRLFAFNDVRARYVCLLAVADTKIEVREEAERGLARLADFTLILSLRALSLLTPLFRVSSPFWPLSSPPSPPSSRVPRPPSSRASTA